MKCDTNNVDQILRLSDDSVECTATEEIDNCLIAYVQKKEAICLCENCGCRMVSKGPRIRTVNHPILQDGRSLILKIKTRKWHCTACNTYTYDSFNFIAKSKQISNLTDLMILDKMKDLSATAIHIAHELSVSDEHRGYY